MSTSYDPSILLVSPRGREERSQNEGTRICPLARKRMEIIPCPVFPLSQGLHVHANVSLIKYMPRKKVTTMHIYNDYNDTDDLISRTHAGVIHLASFDFYHTKVIYLMSN